MVVLLFGVAWAESWCAAPLVLHEWGVDVVRADGQPAVGKPLPTWFHTTGVGGTSAGVAVRTLPKDGGIRTLPVVQLYTDGGWSDPVPFGLEVGFTQGTAKAWFPEVDARGAAQPQLTWDALSLVRKASAAPAKAELPWVQALREVDGALYVERAGESDRFLFYEGDTRETPLLTVARSAKSWTVRNDGPWPAYDVVVKAAGETASIAVIPSHGSVTVSPVAADRAATLAWLRGRWTSQKADSGRQPPCVTMRDPSQPARVAVDHRLYGAEVDILLNAWADRLVEGEGSRIFYREDLASVAAAMPLSAYTDMYHYVEMHRLSVILIEGL